MSFTASLHEIVKQNHNGLLTVHPSWSRVRLSEIATILNGFAFSSNRFSSDPASGFPLIRIRDILKGETETYFSGEFDEEYVVQPGDLIVGMDGDFNCALWAGRPALLNQRVCKLIPRDEEAYDLHLLAYALPGYLKAINDHTSSITVKHLSSRTVADIPLPFPPRNEQRRIVAKIDELFSDLDAGVAALERVRANLKRYRASVLKAAVEGRLTERWRAEHPDTEPASKLLERILTERRKKWEEQQLAQYEAKGKKPPKNWRDKYTEPAAPDTTNLPDLPKGWCWASIEQLNAGDRSIGYGVLQPGPDVAGGIPLVRVCDVDDGKVAVDQLKNINPHISAKYHRTLLLGGEVLLTIVGTIGRSAVAPESLRGANTARAVAVIPVTQAIDPRYLELNLRESSMRARLTNAAHEVARKTLNLEDVRPACIPLAPLEEQKLIISEVEQRLSQNDEADLLLDASLKRATRLRQSILKRAFEGKLVPQDTSDEPADVLLERIHGRPALPTQLEFADYCDPEPKRRKRQPKG